MSDSLEEQQFKSWLRRPTLFIANAWYLLAAAGQTVVPYALLLILRLVGLFFPVSLDQSTLIYTASTIQQIFVLALPVIIYAARHDGVDQAMRLNPPRLDMMLYAVTAALFGVMLSNCISTWWLLLVESLGGWLYTSSIPIPTNVDELTATILLAGVMPGVCEELLFRGGLMGAWERRGTLKAVAITSVLFALLHGSILGLPVQLMMGFALGFVLIVSDSLYVSMTFHTVYNSVTILLSYLSLQLTGGEPVEALTTAEYIMAAGGYGSLFFETLLMASMFAGVLLMMYKAQKQRKVEIIKIVEGDRTKMGWQELLLLLCGLITMGIVYLEDLLWICGIIL